MIRATVKDVETKAEIHLLNGYGEIQSHFWTDAEYSFATAFADKFSVLLVEEKNYLTSLNSPHGFVMDSDSCVRKPRKDLE